MNKKQNIPLTEKKAAQKALLKEVASKLATKDTLFPEKVAYAKAFLELINATEAKAKNA
ncbi:hypothetical protein [Niastella sp. OAS944]|uniref:hypothetical protein n=1 Tax=Niastella sp. OAS944 TaxID=2664089 RepID=UPI003483909F|nr:hypothetical protein [Chitinophagaceae bacterium OAS944]